jgi:hypothetical protein
MKKICLSGFMLACSFALLGGAHSLSNAQSYTAPAIQGFNAVLSEENPEYQTSNSSYTCPAGYPVNCENGKCCQANNVCIGIETCCPEKYPYYCGSGKCATSASTCTGPNSSTTTTDCPVGGCIDDVCTWELALGKDNPGLEQIRDFRDSTLAQSAVGRKIIQIYYNNTGSINAALDRSPALRAGTRWFLLAIAPMLGNKK